MIGPVAKIWPRFAVLLFFRYKFSARDSVLRIAQNFLAKGG